MTETLVMNPPPSTTQPAEPVVPRGLRRVLLDTGYALSALPVALVALVVMVVLLAVGLGLSVVFGGVLLLALAPRVARGFGHLERVRARGMLGRRAPVPTYLRPDPVAGFWRRTLTPLRDPQSWLDVCWCVIGAVTALGAFIITVVWWGVALGGLTYWFWQRYIDFDEENTGLAEILGIGEGRTAESLLNLGLGVVALLTLPFAVRLAALLHGSLGLVLLSSRAELQGQVSRAVGSRDAHRIAEAQSLRRLERDIHDGPQQRLVRLTMDLGRARVQLADDPERAGATIDAALRQARDTVDELRSLSRGIAPPLLVDRGLAAAVEEMAAGCPVPVTTSVRVPDALPPHVETAAYFVVAEALTNVAKHSGARAARVAVGATDDVLAVEVHDDGIGGAHPGKGLGLAGLGQRVSAVGGDLEIGSPDGRGTVLRARFPIGTED